MSISAFSELWVIDHSTTTEEAAGHVGGRMGFGGDIVYRWGNPEMYKAGGPEDRQLFFNHSTEWLPNALPGGDPNGAKLMIFDNRRDRHLRARKTDSPGGNGTSAGNPRRPKNLRPAQADP